MRLHALLLLFILPACGSLSLQNGGLPCNKDTACPSGYECRSDNRCWLAGTGPDLAPPVEIDASEVDLATDGGMGAVDGDMGGMQNADLKGDFAGMQNIDLSTDQFVDLAGDGGAVGDDMTGAADDLTVLDYSMPDLATPDLKPVVMSYPPSSIWFSSGGGSYQAGQGQCNFSTGGSVVFGSATAPGGGGTVTFGYLVNDTY